MLIWSKVVPKLPNFGNQGLSLKGERLTDHPIIPIIATTSGVPITERTASQVIAIHDKSRFIGRMFDSFSLIKDLPANLILPLESNLGYNFVSPFLKDPQHKTSFGFLR